MRLIIHDYAGHAFTAQLARRLAEIGHNVLYISFADFGTPKGRVDREERDPPAFRTRSIRGTVPFNKENLLMRWRAERAYARMVCTVIEAEGADVILSTAPIEVQCRIQDLCKQKRIAFVAWVQDIHSEAIKSVLSRRAAVLGWSAGRYYRRLESRFLARSDRVIVISEDFRNVLSRGDWNIPLDAVEVIHNWANLDEIPLLPKENEWAKEHISSDGLPVIIYSGTLARKHDPSLIMEIARNLPVAIFVFSEGAAVESLRSAGKMEGLNNLHVRPWIAQQDFPRMLAAADVALAIIEQDAATYSVPSKILSYMAAGKPIVASIPHDNLAAIKIAEANAGLVSDPTDRPRLIDNLGKLLRDEGLRVQLGRNARGYAESMFDVAEIAIRFEAILMEASVKRSGTKDTRSYGRSKRESER